VVRLTVAGEADDCIEANPTADGPSAQQGSAAKKHMSLTTPAESLAMSRAV
ncbi:MAG: hypothetical protein JWO11_2011, partial [Nocardioides sp.]|nr:hypothetical protein [Nocardioides sp.]